jgi:hypothetical protein
MKTWWDFYPVMILAVALPFLIGLAPTFEFASMTIGGGLVRQYGVNQVASFLPLEAGQTYVDAFMAAGYGGEVLLFLPIALNVSAVMAAITFAVFSGVIGLGNWVKRSELDSQRKASKGA